MKYLLSAITFYFCAQCVRGAIEKDFPLFWGLAFVFAVIGVAALFIRRKKR